MKSFTRQAEEIVSKLRYQDIGVWQYPCPSYDENEVYQGDVWAGLVPDELKKLLSLAYEEGYKQAKLDIFKKEMDDRIPDECI